MIKKRILGIIIVVLIVSLFACNSNTAFKIEIEVNKAENMEEAFLALNPKGVRSEINPSQALFPFDQLILNSNHLQGLAIYGEYIITNLNGHISLTNVGYIFIYDREGIIQKIPTPEPTIGTELTHTSGMQVIGDYLFLMVSGEDGEPNHMLIYYLKPLNEGGEAYLFQDIIVENFSAASIGGTVFCDNDGEDVVVVCDKDRTLLKSSLGIAQFDFKLMVKAEGSYESKGSELNNVAMFTDSNNVMWILGMESEALGSGLTVQYTDVLNLYRVDIMSDGSYKVSEAIYSLNCNPYNGKTFRGAHFRFGGTAIIDESGDLIVYSTSGQSIQALGEDRLNINEYRP